MKVKHYEQLATIVTKNISACEEDERAIRELLNELTAKSAEASAKLAHIRSEKAKYESALLVIGELRAAIPDARTELTGHASVEANVAAEQSPTREQRIAVNQMLAQNLASVTLVAVEDDGAHPEYGVGYDGE